MHGDRYHGGIPTDHHRKWITKGRGYSSPLMAIMAYSAAATRARSEFIILNKQAPPTYPAQVYTDDTDIYALRDLGKQTGIVTPTTGVVTAHGGTYSVDVAAHTISWQGTQHGVLAVSNLAPAAASTSDRRDIVQVTSVGVVSIKSGTACGYTTGQWFLGCGFDPPVKPALDANNVLLGELYLPGSYGGAYNIVANMITDKSAVHINPTGTAEGIAATSTITRQTFAQTGGADGGGNTMPNYADATLASSLATIGQVDPSARPYVITGCVWTADTAGSSLNGSMTAGTIGIAGIRLTVAAIAAHAFTASKDTYIDFADHGDGTATPTYTAVNNNAEAPVLANSGTSLNTFRCAVIVTNASIPSAAAINQGSPAFSTPVAATTTTFSGTTGTNVNAATMSVAANSLAPAGLLLVPTSLGATMGGTDFNALIRYTSGGGTTTLSGITVVAGSGTITNGVTLTQYTAQSVTDSGGNIIFNTEPHPRLIGMRAIITTPTTTATSSSVPNPVGTLVVTVVIPAGPSRKVKVWAHVGYLQSSAAVGTVIQAQLQVDGAISTASEFKVPVTGDGEALHPETYALLTPGTHTCNLAILQVAAGTITLGPGSFVPTVVGVELV